LGISVNNLANGIFNSVLGSRASILDIERRATGLIQNSGVKSTLQLFNNMLPIFARGVGQFSAVPVASERIVSETGAEGTSLLSRITAVQEHQAVLAQRIATVGRERTARLISGGCAALLAQVRGPSS